MRKLLSIAVGIHFSASIVAADLTKDWPQWRGPGASGAAVASNPPTTWSESENIKWKIDVPGIGSSTPIVLGDRIYVATAVKTDRVKQGVEQAKESPTNNPSEQLPLKSPEQRLEQAPEQRERPQGQRSEGGGAERGNRPVGGRAGGGRGGAVPTNYYDYMVLAYDRATGQEVWRTTLTSQVPHEAGHNTNTFASSSPITDGERIYVSFGSQGIYCLDLSGQKLWAKDLGKMQTRGQFGEGSSPAVHKGTLVAMFF